MSQRTMDVYEMQAVQNAKAGMQELSVDDVDQVSGGIVFFLIAAWAAEHNGGAYTEDRGAGAWG
jgi:hypothetical protein